MAIIDEIYPDYPTALAACGSGYDDIDIAEVVAFKAVQAIDAGTAVPEQALNSIVAVGIAAADVGNRPLAVLDFGGGCGFHYFQVVRATRAPLRWAIVETEIMAARAGRIAQNRFRAFTTITDGAAALGKVDLVHASGSLQYVREPLATLEALIAVQPRYILLARLPLWREPPIVGVQASQLSKNGLGPMPPNVADREIKYPVTVMKLDDILQTLNRYIVVLVMDSASGTYVVHGKPVPGVSIIFRASWA